MQPVEILRAARRLIEDPEHWARGAFARNQFGVSTGITSPTACSWCSIGALHKVSDNAEEAKVHLKLAISQLHPSLGGEIADFNDLHSITHAEVLAVFDKAIQNAHTS